MTNKFQDAQNKLILQATRVAGKYLLARHGSAHVSDDHKVVLTHTIDPNSSEIQFNGTITVYASDLISPIVGVNMTVNSNDIEIASEESIADKVENSLNAQQEVEPIKASLDSFRLLDDGSKYMKVSHPALEDASLGIVGKSEYAASPDKSELLQTIAKDAMARVANETTINFTGSFVEPIIEKKAAGCDQCDAAMINGVFCHETGCPNQKRKNRFEDVMEEENIESSKKSWLTADFDESVAERIPADYPVQPLDDDNDVPGKATCGNCGRSWDDSISTSMTPTPSARCPFEAFHNYSPISINENMPKASSADHLAQVSQLEEQMKNASNEKIKTQAVNALVSMLQANGYGTAKVREVTASNTGFDVMVTVDADATLKAVNIPVEVKENNVISLPKKSLVATLVSSGLDLNARLSEEFSKQVLARIEAEEARIQYEQNEANTILTERPSVKKEASGYDNTMFLGDQDIMELQKHLIPNHENLKKGDKISDGSSQWEIVDTEWQQNDKNENSASIWKLRKCAPPKSEEKEPETKIKI